MFASRFSSRTVRRNLGDFGELLVRRPDLDNSGSLIHFLGHRLEPLRFRV